jgi:hypothetical protein
VQAQLALQLLELVVALVVRAVSRARQVVAALYMYKLMAAAEAAAATKQRLQVAQVQAVVAQAQPVLRRLTLRTLLVQAAALLAAQLMQVLLAVQGQAAARQPAVRVQPEMLVAQANTAAQAEAALRVEMQLLEMVEVQFMAQAAEAQAAVLTVVMLLVTQGSAE